MPLLSPLQAWEWACLGGWHHMQYFFFLFYFLLQDQSLVTHLQPHLGCRHTMQWVKSTSLLPPSCQFSRNWGRGGEIKLYNSYIIYLQHVHALCNFGKVNLRIPSLLPPLLLIVTNSYIILLSRYCYIRLWRKSGSREHYRKQKQLQNWRYV